MEKRGRTLLECGEPCLHHHPLPPLWTGHSINPKCILHTLVRILKEPTSEDQLTRHLYLLEDLRNGLTCGFWLQDLANATKLVQLLLQKYDGRPEYKEYAAYFLKQMHFAPLMTRTNELIDYPRETPAFFDFLGYLLVTTTRASVRKLILDAITSLLFEPPLTCIFSMRWPMLQTQMELSQLPFILSAFMEICSEQIFIDLVRLVSQMSTYSHVMRCQLLRANAHKFTLVRLNPDWQQHAGGPRPDFDLRPETLTHSRDDPLNESLMFVYVLLDAYKNSSLEERTDIEQPSLEALWGLRYAFQLTCMQHNAKSERNFVLALWLLLVDCFPQCVYLQSGIVHEFAALSHIGELPLMGKWSTFTINYDELIDYEFMRLTLLATIIFSEYYGTRRIYMDERVFCGMIQSLHATHWSPPLKQSLHIIVLFGMQKLIRHQLSEFIRCEGCDVITEFGNALIKSPEIIYDGSFDISMQFLRFLFHLLKTNRKENLLSNEFLQRCKCLHYEMFEKLFSSSLKSKNQKLIAQILNNLLVFDVFESSTDIELVVNLMTRLQRPEEKDLHYIPQLVINAIALLWRLGCHNDVNYLYFIKLKGVYMLLDLINDANYVVRIICLGFLIDLLDEGTAIPYFMTWQKGRTGAMHLMMEIFREECKRLRVPLNDDGVITSVDHPLMGIEHAQMLKAMTAEETASLSVTDLFFSCRCKVYSILQVLTQRNADTIEMIKDYYPSFEANMSPQDKITRLLCDKYLKLKLHEMWVEVKLSLTGIEPSVMHANMLDVILEQFHKSTMWLQREQRKVLAIEWKNDLIEEEDFYNLVRETKLGTAIESYLELKFLMNSTKRRAISYRESMPRDVVNHVVRVHKTSTSIKTFRLVKQKLTIQSERTVDPFAVVPPKPVSEEDDDESVQFKDVDDMSNISYCAADEIKREQK